MADLKNWISLFRDKQDQKTYDFIFRTLVTNQFTMVHIEASTKVAAIRTTRLHVFEGSRGGSESSSRIPGLVYHVDLLKDESPLPME